MLPFRKRTLTDRARTWYFIYNMLFLAWLSLTVLLAGSRLTESSMKFMPFIYRALV